MIFDTAYVVHTNDDDDNNNMEGGGGGGGHDEGGEEEEEEEEGDDVGFDGGVFETPNGRTYRATTDGSFSVASIDRELRLKHPDTFNRVVIRTDQHQRR